MITVSKAQGKANRAKVQKIKNTVVSGVKKVGKTALTTMKLMGRGPKRNLK